jgi:hypothetical protein
MPPFYRRRATCRHSVHHPKAREGEAGGPSVAGGSGGRTVGGGRACAARVAREKERLEGPGGHG